MVVAFPLLGGTIHVFAVPVPVNRANEDPLLLALVLTILSEVKEARASPSLLKPVSESNAPASLPSSNSVISLNPNSINGVKAI